MKFMIVFLALFLYAANIDKKITTTKTTLNQTRTKISNMNSQLDSIVKKINREEIYLSNINKQISILNQKIKELQKSLNKNNEYLTKLTNKRKLLIAKKDELEQKVIDFIANNYYIQNSNTTSQKDLVNEEILKVIAKESAKKMDKISTLYEDIDTQIQKITTAINKIKNTKAILQKRKQELAELKRKKQQNIKQLQAIKLKYKQELQKIISNQNKLQNQLSKLNIIKTEELKKQRELAKQRLKELKKLKEAKRQAEQQARQQEKQAKKVSKIDKLKVKNYGNIYMKSKTIKYRGAKTIPPVKGIITKKFGAYTDPVYRIALYNDSITIKTKPNAKVRAIFSGKVVFVGDTNEGKMIVIKHNNRLHSIYAKLSRISPFIKKGYRVKKGEVIAKVDNELEFEVTYKTLPINPLQVIKF